MDSQDQPASPPRVRRRAWGTALAAVLAAALAILAWCVATRNAGSLGGGDLSVIDRHSLEQHNRADPALVMPASTELPRRALGGSDPLASGRTDDSNPVVIEIHALSGAGVRVNAEVEVIDSSGRALVGQTLVDRALRVSLDSLTLPAAIRAKGEGQPVTLGQFDLTVESLFAVVEVVLSESGRIEGVLVDESGLPVTGGGTVVAVAAGQLAAQVCDAILTGTPAGPGEWAAATVDPDGTFAVDGLWSGTDYRLHAAGPGRASSALGGGQRVAAGTTGVRVACLPVYGCLLRLVGDGAAETLEELRQRGRSGLDLHGLPALSSSLPIRAHPAVAATILGRQIHALEPGPEIALLRTMPAEAEGLDGTLSLEFPWMSGSGPAPIRIPRLRGEGLPLVEVEAQVVGADHRGSIRFEAMLGPGLKRLDESTVVAWLILARPGVTSSFELTIGDLLGGGRIDLLASGVFEWRLEAAGGGRLLPDDGRAFGLVDVEGDSATLLFDLRGFGSAVLTVFDEEGRLFVGGLTARLRELTWRAPFPGGTQLRSFTDVADQSWSHPPFVVPFVSPGERFVAVDADMAGLRLGQTSRAAEFRAGELTRVTIR
ncbi:carboxypeptidase-like regulatory domain-containing protein [Engelhardtia mirabilis]|uniref:Uncharacterized protein n=1 Tax=Engelhardtia mirabilis TaxID=2528011 RepID=A0A518BJD8_9BACT|nr:hypothetical protein Pla133_21690 [Planctomycetes bacterium Pla133]QDV01418.1 hypothetical protein Pla86_21690 [Planctomycetes bacterium Pla86]